MGLYACYQKIDKAFMNIPMAKRATSIASENLVQRSTPRVIMQVCVWLHINRLFRDTGANAFRVGCPNVPFSVLFLKQINDDHRYPADPFGALEDFKIVLEKARRQTVREPSRDTPDSLGAKLLTASTALRAYRNRHLGTLMRCCEAWEPVGKCFDPTSFECTTGLAGSLRASRVKTSQNEKLK